MFSLSRKVLWAWLRAYLIFIQEIIQNSPRQECRTVFYLQSLEPTLTLNLNPTPNPEPWTWTQTPTRTSVLEYHLNWLAHSMRWLIVTVWILGIAATYLTLKTRRESVKVIWMNFDRLVLKSFNVFFNFFKPVSWTGDPKAFISPDCVSTLLKFLSLLLSRSSFSCRDETLMCVIYWSRWKHFPQFPGCNLHSSGYKSLWAVLKRPLITIISQ